MATGLSVVFRCFQKQRILSWNAHRGAIDASLCSQRQRPNLTKHQTNAAPRTLSGCATELEIVEDVTENQ